MSINRTLGKMDKIESLLKEILKVLKKRDEKNDEAIEKFGKNIYTKSYK